MRTFFKPAAFLLVSLMLAGLAAYPLFSPGASAQEGPAASKIGFVDLKKVIEGYKLTAQLEAEIEKEREVKNKEIDLLRGDLKGLRSDLELLNRETMVYASTYGRMKVLEARVNAEEEALKSWLQFRLLKSTAKVYDDVVKGCKELRLEMNLDAILKAESSEIQSESQADLIMRINSRSVLTWNGELDLTDRVLERLNRKR